MKIRVDIKTAQRWLDHASFQMTIVYTHLSKGKEQSVVEKLDGYSL
jgi:site-specific recombinase XerD